MKFKNVKIIDATEHHCDSIMTMIKELAAYERMSDSVKLSSKQLREDLKNGFLSCIVALVEAEVIGFALYVSTVDIFLGNRIYLEDFFVKAEYRGNGIGSKIWNQLKTNAADQSCTGIDFSLLRWNTPSEKYYMNRNCVNETHTSNWEVFRKVVENV